MNRGKPLARKSSLRRKTWMKRKRSGAPRLRAGQLERDEEWLADVRCMPCCARELGGCSGRVEADHIGRRGLGQKSGDRITASHCTTHHGDRDHFHGVFKGWTQAQMRDYLAGALALTIRRVLELRAARERRASAAPSG